MKKEITKNKCAFSIKPYLKEHIWRIIIVMFCYAVSMTMSLIATIKTADLVANISTSVFNSQTKHLIILCISLSLSRILVDFIIDALFVYIRITASNKMGIDIAEQVFRIQSQSFSDHSTTNFTRRISTDPVAMFNYIEMVLSLTMNFMYHLVITIYLLTINWIIAIIISLGLAIGIGIDMIRRKLNYKNGIIMEQAGERVGALHNEIIRSEKDIKSLNLESRLKEENQKRYADYQKKHFKTNYTNIAFSYARSFIVNIFSIGVLLMGIYLRAHDTIALATFMLIYSNSGSFKQLSNGFGRITQYMTEIQVRYNRIKELYADDEYKMETFGKRKLKNIKGHIEFKNVAYTYVDYENIPKAERQKGKDAPKRRISNKTKVFDDLSFTIEPNTTVAFVGKSGSGKSTILNLMAKMYTADSGKILIDGVNINSLDKESLRKSISLVNQFPYIFDMTIKENLMFAKQDATDEEINKALKDAALDEFVATLKDGVNTKVGESGVKLSGGQKQRLAIARALLKNSAIILFDESTSSLDNIAQNQVKKSIENIQGKSTVVVVAHRLSTIKNADVIYFLENGKIVDFGTFKELYARNKNFKTMFLAENI